MELRRRGYEVRGFERAQVTIGALATGAGLLLSLGAARLLRVGRFG